MIDSRSRKCGGGLVELHHSPPRRVLLRAHATSVPPNLEPDRRRYANAHISQSRRRFSDFPQTAPPAASELWLVPSGRLVAVSQIVVVRPRRGGTGIGEPFTGPPASVSGNDGVALQATMGLMRDWNFRNDTTHNYCGGQGTRSATNPEVGGSPG